QLVGRYPSFQCLSAPERHDSLPYCNCAGGRDIITVTNADEPLGYTEVFGKCQHFVAQLDVWCSIRPPHDFNTPPRNVTDKTGTKRFCNGFLTGESAGVVAVMSWWGVCLRAF